MFTVETPQERTKNKYSFLEDLLMVFLVLSESAIFAYKVDNSYAPTHDAGIRWDDPTLNIRWGVNERGTWFGFQRKM